MKFKKGDLVGWGDYYFDDAVDGYNELFLVVDNEDDKGVFACIDLSGNLYKYIWNHTDCLVLKSGDIILITSTLRKVLAKKIPKVFNECVF